MKEHLFRNCNCKGGGGGSSGKVEYPAYLEAVHTEWLGSAISQSVTDTMDTAFAASPFTGASAYNPATPIAAMDAAIPALVVVANSAEITTGFPILTALIQGDPSIAAEIAAAAAEIDWNIANVILPRFQRGMQDINAVYSSSFVLGEALIESQATIQKTKYAAELRNRFMIQSLAVLADMWKFEADIAFKVYTTSIEKDRMKIVALKEQADKDLQIDEADAKWDLEVFAHGANVMAAISGGTSHAQGAKAGTVQSAIGGAMSGAAMGAMVSGGNPIGIGVGAVIGGLGGALM